MRFRRPNNLHSEIFLRLEDYILVSFQIEGNMIILANFLLIMKQTQFSSVAFVSKINKKFIVFYLNLTEFRFVQQSKGSYHSFQFEGK